MNPRYISKEDIPQQVIDEMKEEFKKQLEWSWKPADIIDRIVEWKLAKEYTEIVLLEQPYIRDETKKIKEILPEWFKIIEIKRFAI